MKLDFQTRFAVRQMDSVRLHHFIQELRQYSTTVDVNEWLKEAGAVRLRRMSCKGETGYLYQLLSGDLFWSRLDGLSYVLYPLSQ